MGKKEVALIGVSLLAPLAMLSAQDEARAADTPIYLPIKAAPTPPSSYPADWDKQLGDDFWTRLVKYYGLEWGHDSAPPDPTAPPGRRDYWPATPQTSPPYPFTEWPYGGTTNLGVNRPNSVDSPLMVALAHSKLGQWMNDQHIQVYGWLDVGGNMSTNDVKPGGNWPAAYSYTPNTVQLDQAVIYAERTPDTVQKDHIDWGFRLSAIYGENYRYTTTYGIASYQLLNKNLVNGYDFPMVYGELFVPRIAEGMMIRVGRFISVPDIEAQLAPNNYMYSHSMTYTFDNYTNTGIETTTALTKNWTLQLGVVAGTETVPWRIGVKIPNPFPNPIYPNTTMLKDPGAQPSLVAGIRWTSDSGYDNINIVADGINNGVWGYNNLQWYGLTYYHKFNEQWHISIEAYELSQKKVLNATDPLGIIANGGFPFNANQIQFNAPSFAQCNNPAAVTCTARAWAALAYLNYRVSALDNISWRAEFYKDEEGQRTGTKTRYVAGGIGWQHWFSPQIEFRPEVSYYKSLDAPAFNGNFNALPAAIAPTKNYALIGMGDVIIHF